MRHRRSVAADVHDVQRPRGKSGGDPDSSVPAPCPSRGFYARHRHRRRPGQHQQRHFRCQSPPIRFETPLRAIIYVTDQRDVIQFQKIFVINLPNQHDHRDAAVLAAALSGLEIEFIDGVFGDDVPNSALPPEWADRQPTSKEKGSWRAHMNAIQQIVRQNLTTALILEDDVDWDVRVRSQFQDFAKATRLLIQPLIPETGEMGALGGDQYLDPTFPVSSEGAQHSDIDVRQNVGRTKTPTTSPYGDVDRWDLLWPGHCGAEFPEDTDKLSLGRAVLYDDETAAEVRHFDPQWGDGHTIHDYPDHTRITYRAKKNVCNLAYALTRDGARRALYELGVHKNIDPTDLSLREYCDGDNGRPARVCLTVQPPLMMHHNPVHKDSTGEPISKNIRVGTKVNFPKLVEGAPESEYIDRFKDEGK
nr:hypothetical protein CFP56_43766 [Quercus suber]